MKIAQTVFLLSLNPKIIILQNGKPLMEQILLYTLLSLLSTVYSAPSLYLFFSILLKRKQNHYKFL